MTEHLPTPEVNTTTVYHVFSDQRDAWFEEEKFDEAKAQFTEWGKESGCARLYRELQDENGEMIDEECLDSIGAYPL